MPLFLCAVCCGVWRWEGVQELFLGLVLFQALHRARDAETLPRREVRKPRRVRRVGARRRRGGPHRGDVRAAYFVPEAIDWLVSNRTHASVAPYWAALEYYYSFLGFSTADGDNPYRVLGVHADGVHGRHQEAVPASFRAVSPGQDRQRPEEEGALRPVTAGDGGDHQRHVRRRRQRERVARAAQRHHRAVFRVDPHRRRLGRAAWRFSDGRCATARAS